MSPYVRDQIKNALWEFSLVVLLASGPIAILLMAVSK